MRARLLLPLALFVVLVGFLALGLRLDPREVPSPLVDKSAPAFSLEQLHQPGVRIAAADMKGQVWLLNVWASWCVSCREEHPLLVELGKSKVVPIVGLNYKDRREDALAWLERLGNPYVVSAMDADGRVGIDYGVYGVPETYLIDRDGIIRFKQIGPVTPKVLQESILPLVKKLRG
jgi:cytochrome c biogenesis protein CcmG/thiol:disulfide interchange protein DsbE